MKKFLIVILSLILAAVPAFADTDLAAMSTEELTQLRLSIDRELASRAGDGAAQVISVDGVLFRFLLAEVGQARDDHPGLGVILLADNPSEKSMTTQSDLGVTVTHGGVPLDISWVVSEHFSSSSVSTSQKAVIRPGASGMLVYLGFILDGSGGSVEITLSRKHTRSGEDPYCGTFFATIDAPV